MLENELQAARDAAKEAGQILNHFFGQAVRIYKKGEIDLVTDADLQSEKKIIEIIGSRFPGDAILTEESGTHKQVSDRRWIIDPLDGTVNFAHGFPIYAISIGLEIKGRVVLGVVANPVMEEYFEALEGRGAFLNGSRIRVSGIRTLVDALLVTGFPYNVHEKPDEVVAIFKKMLVTAQGVRRPGSAAIDLCYVAAGRFDGYWEKDLKPWDTAAGSLIVREAGGVVSTYKGEDYTPFRRSIIASNPHLHKAILEAVAQVRETDLLR